MSTYDFPTEKQYHGLHYEICKPLEDLMARAHGEGDHALLRVAGTAWLLAGYAPNWIVDPLALPGRTGTNDRYAFVEAAFRGRNRAKLRNEGLGLLRGLEALYETGKLSTR